MGFDGRFESLGLICELVASLFGFRDRGARAGSRYRVRHAVSVPAWLLPIRGNSIPLAAPFETGTSTSRPLLAALPAGAVIRVTEAAAETLMRTHLPLSRSAVSLLALSSASVCGGPTTEDRKPYGAAIQ